MGLRDELLNIHFLIVDLKGLTGFDESFVYHIGASGTSGELSVTKNQTDLQQCRKILKFFKFSLNPRKT